MSTKPYGLAVKALVTGKDGNCLLIRRSAASKHFAGKWDMPGGKVDPGEDIGDALCREVNEETGLEVVPEKVLGVTEFDMKAVRVIVLYFQVRTGSRQVVLSREHDDFRWVSRQELARMDVSEQLQEFVGGLNR